MQRPAEFDVSLMGCKEFIEVVREGVDSDLIYRADLIICTIEFSDDFL
jgi:hypothetical protein